MKNLIAVLLCSAAFTPAFADANDPQSSGAGVEEAAEAPANEQNAQLGDIVVTAQRRETKLERTPMTINVVSGAQLQSEGIREIRDLKASVPGLTLNESPGGLPGITVRGIGTSSSAQLAEQSVGMFVDGVYHPRQRQYRDAMFDVERIEVIKGSQGILFGKNTSVGAVSIITKGPGDETGGYAQIDHEVNYGSTNAEGAVDLRLSPSFGVRVSGLYQDINGWVENVSRDRKEASGNRYAVRGVAEWNITDTLDAVLKLQWGRLDTLGNAFEFVNNLNSPGLVAIGVLDGGQKNFVKYETAKNAPDTNDHQISFDPSLIVNLEVGDGYTITSTTGYSRYTFQNGFDSDSSPLSFLQNQFNERFGQFSQEVRLSSPTDSAVDFIVGGIYLNAKSNFNYLSYYNGFPVAGGLFGTVSQRTEQSEHTWAGFANVNWRIIENLTLSVGGRLSSNVKSATYTKSLVDNIGYPNNLVSLLTVPSRITEGRNSDTTLDYSATLNYNFLDTATAYVAIGRGNKSAAFNNQSALAAPSPKPFIVPKETVVTYEAGIKGRFLDGRAYASLAGFILNVSDLQDSFYDPVARAFQLRSIDARSRGIEGEAQFQIAQPISIYGNFAWLPTAKSVEDERLQRAPKFTYTLGLRGDGQIATDWGASGFINIEHAGNYLHQPASAAGDNNSLPYTLLNARLQLTYDPIGVSVYVMGTNLTNEVYRTFVFGSPLALGGVGSLNQPRMVTIGARYTF